MATRGLGEGRSIPLLIIDAEERPDLFTLVNAHETNPPGDMTCRWGTLDKDTVILLIKFLRPIEIEILLTFNIEKYGGLIDTILTSKAFYLQPGKDGDRLSNTIDNPRIIVEIPETGFKQIWDDIYFKQLRKSFRQKGLNRQQSKKAAKNMIHEFRKITGFRMS